MSDVDVQFVSLVEHAANRTPFVIMKQAGGDKMNKAVQAILIPSTVPEEEVQKELENCRTDEVKDGGSFKLYVQADQSLFKEGTLDVMKKENGVMYIIGELSDGASAEKLDIENGSVELKAANMEDLAYEFYGLGDIVLGALYQESLSSKERTTIILTAVKSFASFTETFLGSVSKDSIKMISKDAFPDRVHTLKKEEKLPESSTTSPVSDSPESKSDDSLPAGDEVPYVTEDRLQEMLSQMVESLKKDLKITELSDSIKSVTEKVESLDASMTSTTKSYHHEMDDPLMKSDEDKSVFKGVFLRK
jgi:hypothetical protein